MKKMVLGIIVLLFLCIACRKERVFPVNQLVKDLFCFKTGSEWTYYDSVSQTTQKVVITNYKISKFGGGKPYIGKVYDFAESIRFDFTVENAALSLFKKCSTWLEAEIGRSNTLDGRYISIPVIDNTQACKEFMFWSDEKNNFSPSADYLSTYTLYETTYSDVYVFKKMMLFTMCLNTWALFDV